MESQRNSGHRPLRKAMHHLKRNLATKPLSTQLKAFNLIHHKLINLKLQLKKQQIMVYFGYVYQIQSYLYLINF